MTTPLGDRIKVNRERLGISQSELGRQLGLTRASISQYELGAIKEMKMGQLIRMAKALKVDPEELATGKPSSKGAFQRQEIVFVPVIEIGEADNFFARITADPAIFEERKHMAVTKNIHQGYALEITDDEMVAPDSPIRIGGYVAFESEAEAKTGLLVLVKIGDAAPLFRQLRISGDRHLLRPLNPQYPATETSAEGYTILGVARQFITML